MNSIYIIELGEESDKVEEGEAAEPVEVHNLSDETRTLIVE